jgi:c-di-GMP-binding flagellar brake protein YcgR
VLLIAELVIIAILVTALLMLMVEEEKIKRGKIPKGAVEEYWKGMERRKSIRIDASFIVRYTVEEKPNTKLNCRTKDISRGGMGLLVNEKLKGGTLLLLEFLLPDGQVLIKAEGKVAWSSGEFNERNELGKRIFHMGIEFVNIKPEARDKLVSYIDKIATET